LKNPNKIKGLHWIKWTNSCYTNELTAKDAKESIIEEVRVLVKNSLSGSVIILVRKQVFTSRP
jgi:hypothetical protein